jgi:CubicO group peptidase (beta-lactamase class C family)
MFCSWAWGSFDNEVRNIKLDDLTRSIQDEGSMNQKIHVLMLKWRSLSIFLLCLLTISASFLLPSCRLQRNIKGIIEGYQIQVPPETNDGWETAHLTDVGMEEAYLIELMNELKTIDEHHIHSLIIVKDGKLVFEEYFPGEKFNLAQWTGETGFDQNDTHNLCSVTKSFTSAILGIAMDQGFIHSVDQKVIDFFPEYIDLFSTAPEKHDLTLHHLLTMTSGIEWDDETTSYYDPSNDMHQMFTSIDPMEFILAKDISVTPGSLFDYSNCNTNVLGEIVRRATGQRIDIFAKRTLFDKLGITDFEWQMLPNDVVFTSGDLRLRPRDMAKFGYLFLNGGMWEEERVISQDWIELSTYKYIDLNRDPNFIHWADGYGYQWWLWESLNSQDFNAYVASGWGGQWIIISPELDLVVVSTAGNYYTAEKMPIQTIITEYILPSISP